jgi:pimeloyl-ACP methyl ester carboxylesterase
MLRRCLFAILTCAILLLAAKVRAEDQFFDSNGVKIHYTVQGQGEPVILIHGFGINEQFQWVVPGIVKALAKEYRVIALDCRGHGQSGKPHDPMKYGIEMVEDVVRLLDHLKIKKDHVVGYSMGGFITVKLLSMHPDRLLSATTGGAGWPKKMDTEFLDELGDSLDQGKGMGPLIVRLTPLGRPKPTAERIKAINSLMAALNDVKALAAVIRGMKGLGIPEEKLKMNKVPTLAIIGEVDPLKEGVDELKEQMPSLQVVVIKEADHMVAFARPEFVQALKEFLAKNGQGEKSKKPEAVSPGSSSRR